jgi:hypothetical protein
MCLPLPQKSCDALKQDRGNQDMDLLLGHSNYRRGEIPGKSWTEKFSVQAYIPVYSNFISLNSQ